MTNDDELDYILKIHKDYLDEMLNMKIIHMFKNLQKKVMLCLYIEHAF